MNAFFSRKTGYGLLAVLILATMVCGCFQATNRFYLDSDITTDKRFEGRFAAQATNQDSSVVASVVIKLDRKNHYIATFREGEYWMKLDTVLFMVGTNLFVDISHLSDNGTPQHSGSTPSGLDLLQRVTRDKNHVAIRFQFLEDGVEFQLALGVPFVRAINKVPTLKLREVDDHFAILLDPTDKLRSFLTKVGSDDSFFQQKSRWVRIAK